MFVRSALILFAKSLVYILQSVSLFVREESETKGKTITLICFDCLEFA